MSRVYTEDILKNKNVEKDFHPPKFSCCKKGII